MKENEIVKTFNEKMKENEMVKVKTFIKKKKGNEIVIDEIKPYGYDECSMMYQKHALRGQNILIVMLWSKELDPQENQYIHKDYLLNRIPQNDSCLKDCLDYYGIKIDIVENYREAIEKITSKNEEGKCPYYAVWIINGPPYEELPDGTKEAYLL